MYYRSFSAPPVDKLSIEDDVELEQIHLDINFKNYYRKNFNVSLKQSGFFQNDSFSFLPIEQNDLILNAFQEKRTVVQMIDEDYPDSESCQEYVERCKTSTPVGDKPVIHPSMLKSSNSTIFIPSITSTVQKLDNNLFLNEIKTFYEIMSDEVAFDTKHMCVSVCKDQEGSRFIQSKLDEWNDDQILYFFNQIVGSALDLSTNLFGNYVIQKIIPFLREEDAFKLILQFFGEIYELSIHVYGCRVIQKLIDNLEDIKFIVAELESKITDLIESPNGNHVIQKCIDKEIDKGFIIKEFENDCITLSQQRYGCRVLQRLFEVCSEEETWSIYNTIIGNINILINDKYGNYVIQHLIQTNNKKRDQIIDFIVNNSFDLSKFKFSSNVIEKCVNSSNKKQLEAFLQQFAKIGEGSKPHLYYMCIDMYANYVVQRFFDVADNEMKNKAKSLLKPYLKEMKMIPFTKHILARLN